MLLYIYGTEIIIKGALLNRTKVQDQTDLPDPMRLEGLNSVLTAIERWFEVFNELPFVDTIGITCNIFIQFWRCIMLLFKLTTLEEPGWDKEVVRKRVDFVNMLERFAQRLDRIPAIIGMMDADGINKNGVFFKSALLLRSAKALFLAELTASLPQMDTEPRDNPGPEESVGGFSVPDDIVMNLASYPWMADILMSLGNF